MGDLYQRLKAQRERQKSPQTPAAGGQSVARQPAPVATVPVRMTSAPSAAAMDSWQPCADLVWERRAWVVIDPAWWDFVTDDLDTAGKAALAQELSGTVCLDTETTGLAGGTGTYAFLVGWCRLDPPYAEIRQIFMQDLGGEGAMIAHIHRLLDEISAYCSYNGASFDLPLLRMRWALSGREFPIKPHQDCLHPARRLWKSRLESCALSNIEAHVLGFHRPDDVPGALVPQLYLDYLRSGAGPDFLEQLGGVFRHHACDVYSLAMLHLLLRAMRRQVFSPRWLNNHTFAQPKIGAYDEGVIQPRCPQQIAVDPRGLLRFCSPIQELTFEELMWQQTRESSWGLALAKRYRKIGDPQYLQKAVDIWIELMDRRQDRAALVAWLKFAEHLNRQPELWRQAILKIDQAQSWPGVTADFIVELERRRFRLQRHLSRAKDEPSA